MPRHGLCSYYSRMGSDKVGRSTQSACDISCARVAMHCSNLKTVFLIIGSCCLSMRDRDPDLQVNIDRAREPMSQFLV